MRRVSAPWVMFLDSDDVLPEGAVERLLTPPGGTAATSRRAPAYAASCPVDAKCAGSRSCSPPRCATRTPPATPSCCGTPCRSTSSTRAPSSKATAYGFPTGVPLRGLRVHRPAVRGLRPARPHPGPRLRLARTPPRAAVHLPGPRHDRQLAQQAGRAAARRRHPGTGGRDRPRRRRPHPVPRPRPAHVPAGPAAPPRVLRDTWWSDTRLFLTADGRTDRAVAAARPRALGGQGPAGGRGRALDGDLVRLAQLAARPGWLLPPYARTSGGARCGPRGCPPNSTGWRNCRSRNCRSP
ncbi:hypothetical protein NKH77_40310 [Streptomyces sp. M19]